MRVWIISLFFVLVTVLGEAAVVPAASPSRADVVAAIEAASPGDTVTIPAGTGTWNENYSFSKAITLQGAGVGQTIIKCDSPAGDSWSSGLLIINNGAEGLYRITGIEFQRERMTNSVGGLIRFEGSGTNAVVDNCFFNEVNNHALTFYGTAGGVIDNCEFSLQGNTFALQAHNGGVYGNPSWASHAHWGETESVVYLQNSVIYRSGSYYPSVDGWTGCRFVVRDNTFTNAPISNHGTESAQIYRSGRTMEVYRNTFVFDAYSYPPDSVVDIRGGTARVWGNTATGPSVGTMMKLNNYRSLNPFLPWGHSDGTLLWDRPDLTDGAGTPGGAGDGVFETGTANTLSTSGPSSLLTSTGKSWSTNQWANFLIRQYATFTITSGGPGTITVSGAGWATNEWAGWTLLTNSGQFAHVQSNTSETLTVNPWYFQTSASSGAVTLSYGEMVLSNTGDTITTKGTFQGTPGAFKTGLAFEIRQLDWSLDQPGAGASNTPTSQDAPPNQDLEQGSEPIYYWGNTYNSTALTGTNGVSTAGYQNIKGGRDYFGEEAPGYTPLGAHPLVSAPSAPSFTLDPVSATRTVGESVTFTASATGNPSPTYQWRKSGANITGATSSSYTIASVELSDASTFDVVATNSEGVAFSASATLTVNSPTPPGDGSISTPSLSVGTLTIGAP